MMRGENISKYRMTKTLLKLDEEGNIVNRREKRPWDNSGLEYLKVRKFKIEPYGTNVGFYSIDGEVDCYLNKVNLKKKN